MPKSARVLQFPVRSAAMVLTAEGARLAAQAFLSEPHALRSPETWEYFANPDVIIAVLDVLKKVGNSQPEYGHAEAVAAYGQLSKTSGVGVFDERDYFLGEIALLAGSTARVAGRFDVAEHWFDLSDSAFRHTINPAPLLVRVTHARLALRYDMGRYREVLALLPTVVGEYSRLGMATDLAKAKFLQAVTLKQLGEFDRSLDGLVALRAELAHEPTFQALVLTNLAEEYGRRADQAQAILAYEEALALTKQTGDTMTSIHLKTTLGEAYRTKGDYPEAISLLRGATLEASENGMQTRLAYLRVLLAECLLASGRSREAEWEILAALPVIEEQKMVAEGVTAIAILRESVNRRRIDGSALADLRHRLSAR